jgi:hypothetical protein
MTKRNTIIRAPHDRENGYFACARATPQDRELSWEARGVLWYLLSKPGDWEVQPDDLKQQCGRDKVYKILKELTDAKYIKREKTQNPKTKQWEWGPYMVYERPYDTLQGKVKPFPEMPDTALPDTETPDTAKAEINTHIKEGTDLENDSPSENDGGEKPKRVVKRTPIFITLARESFQIFNVDGIAKQSVIRINILERWLKEHSPGATEQTLIAFYEWYDRQHPGAARPKGENTFAENFEAFKQQKLAEAAKRTGVEAQALDAREAKNKAKAEEQRIAIGAIA